MQMTYGRCHNCNFYHYFYALLIKKIDLFFCCYNHVVQLSQSVHIGQRGEDQRNQPLPTCCPRPSAMLQAEIPGIPSRPLLVFLSSVLHHPAALNCSLTQDRGIFCISYS